jgi:hypothetical protein
MQHLNEEQLVSHYYHDDEAPAAAEAHLASCPECRAQFETIRRVLTLVSDAPVPERGDAYAGEVWTRLRWKLGAPRRRVRWTQFAAAAAVLAVAFFAGQWWHARNLATAPIQTASTGRAASAVPVAASNQEKNRVLFVVVSDHLESSERMLAEVANADPHRDFDVAGERAADLVASNRIYRQSAMSRGDHRIAALLSDLEPILVELSHADKTIGPAELESIQKRIESKGLLFKVRVMSAQTGSGGDKPAPANSSSL